MYDSKPLLAIAIPTYNRADHLARLLGRLTRELQGACNVTLYISDNGSTDHTRDVVAQFASVNPGVRTTRYSHNLGPDENFCGLIDQVDAEYLWLIGDDDLPHIGALAATLSLLDAVRPDTAFLTADWVKESEPIDVRLTGRPRADLMSRDDFARRVNIWTTFISGWIVRTELAQLNPARRFAGTSLVQLGWTLAGIEAGDRHLFVVTPMLQATAGNSGGYPALSVFGASYATVTRKALGGTAAGQSLAEAMIRRSAVGYLPGLIWDLRRGTAGQFASGVSARELASNDVGGALWRRLILVPIASAHPTLARPILLASQVVFKGWTLLDRVYSRARRSGRRV